jgi:hypothetical protein
MPNKPDPRKHIRLAGIIDRIAIKGDDPPVLTVTIACALTDANVDNALLLADFKRHGGPVDIDIAQIQLTLEEAN